MKKEFRIRKRRDFVKASRVGLCYRSSSVVVLGALNDLENSRVGFTASRKVGGAVERNRCKRRMRAAADVVFSDLCIVGVDYVFIARKAVYNVKWDNLVGEIVSAVRFLNNKILKCKEV